jgi:hypothetical protein
MPSKRLFLVSALVVSAFAGGALSSRVFAGDARADARPTTATIYVPADGLVFRSPEGKTIARISSDASGGVLELYNEKEQPGARLRTGGVTGSADFGSSAAQPAPQQPQGPVGPRVVNRKDLGF